MVRFAKPRERWLRADADALKSPKKRLSDKKSDRPERAGQPLIDELRD
jgi:hypothetical protein